ncbi:MAG: SRPBCC family protein [Methylophilaceae bacterium]|nr:SRPBCC family protein [Methylophilaceae bacterium]
MKQLLAIMAAAMLPFTASAHGPSPQKVEKEIVIKAAPAKVWAVLKDSANIGKWHPSPSAVKVKSADDGDMKLKYELADGAIAAADYNAFLAVKAGPGAGESTVTWVARFYRVYKLNPPIPAGQDDESAVKAVNGLMEAGAANLKKLVE